MRIRTAAAVGFAVLAAGGVAACGDDEDDATTSGGGGAAATAPAAEKPAGEPIVVGSISSATGVQQAIYGGADEVMKAWESDVNARGGLNGHPVKLIFKDDGGDPAKATQYVRELKRDGAVAIVSGMSLADSVVAKEAGKAELPVVGGSALPPYLTNPDYFPSGTSLVGLAFGTIKMAKDAGKKKLGVMVCSESPVCGQLVPLAQGVAKIVGGIEVVPSKVSSTAPNYTAPCLAAKEKGVDALFPALNGQVIQRVLASCKQQGYTPTPVVYDTTTTPELLKDANMDGALIPSANASPYDESVPGVERYREAVDRYAGGLTGKDQFTALMTLHFSGGMLFEAAAKAGKLTPQSTSDDVRAAVVQLKEETLEGLAPPLSFTKGQPTFTPCWFESKVAGEELEPLGGSKPACMTAEQGTALGKALAG